MPVVEREETTARTELGAAQKDTARELGAKLSSLKGIVWVGIGLFVFGLASLVYPPLKVIIGSVTTSAALMLGGVALMVLPTLVVGNELLILGVVGLAVGGWFLAHRHGQLRGIVAASTGAQNNAPPSSAATPSVADPRQPPSRLLITFQVSRITTSRITHHEHKSQHSNPSRPAISSRAGRPSPARPVRRSSSRRNSLAARPPSPSWSAAPTSTPRWLLSADHIHAGHLAILEKLDINHRELLAALERQATRINTLESGLARVDETNDHATKGGRTSS